MHAKCLYHEQQSVNIYSIPVVCKICLPALEELTVIQEVRDISTRISIYHSRQAYQVPLGSSEDNGILSKARLLSSTYKNAQLLLIKIIIKSQILPHTYLFDLCLSKAFIVLDIQKKCGLSHIASLPKIPKVSQRSRGKTCYALLIW